MQEPDPADLGTAFGMEASLEPMDFQSSAGEYELESRQVAAASGAAADASPLAWLNRRS
ncbi:hypothetical protein [Pelomonas sp. KK5]|uniref:hypothetical protein n=1 Tax=Pelomonas sp. KK5 TaxID=1855730 RepID=UPI001301EDB9|nr:hypothetical protein [Pelomonas sp. KK5]